MEVTLDKFGRILIPKSIRKLLGVESGSKLRISCKDSHIVLEPSGIEDAIQEVGELLVYTGEFDENIMSLLEKERAERDKSIL